MKNLFDKIDWSKAVKVVPIAMAGVMAVMSAVGEQKAADKLEKMENRISELEQTRES